MKHLWLLIAALGLGLAAGSVCAQQPDYLTPEEVEKVRDAQEPNKRVALFLEFAAGRLLLFEKALAGAPGQEPVRPYQLKDMLNDFIRAVDDSADALDTALNRGGADLRKTRVLLIKDGAEFLARLERAQKTEPGASEDLRYDLEDAVEAVRDLATLAKGIPDHPIPPKGPVTAGKEEGQEKPAPAGRPTLKRRQDDKPK